MKPGLPWIDLEVGWNPTDSRAESELIGIRSINIHEGDSAMQILALGFGKCNTLACHLRG